MKTNKKLHSIALASAALILFLVLVSSAASAATEQSASPTITETRITTDASNQEYPAIYGNKIAWEDYRNGKAAVYIYDLSTKKETQIATVHQSNSMWGPRPHIYGNKVVWQDIQRRISDIYLQDLSTMEQTQITANRLAYEPAIYGDRIVYDAAHNGSFDIYMYNISTKNETQITTTGSAYEPAIYDDRIVYEANRNVHTDIYMYDLSTKKEKRITTNSSDPRFLAIYGDRIVWDDGRNGDWDIYMYDISTSKETRITTNESDQMCPAIYGDRIIWEDERYDVGEPDIYMYDLSTKKETQITTSKRAWEFPSIYGDRIVWQDSRNGNFDIYMATLSTTSPVAAFSASPTSGKVPLSVKYTDKSTGSPTSWKWSFGDGTNSTAQNPTHKYIKVGKYTVKLTVKNAAGSNTATKSSYISVTSMTKPVAAFSASSTSGNAPLNVTFTDKSTGSPTVWKWTFGDGTNSITKNPTHTYSKAGNYTVALTVSNTADNNTTIKTNYIKVTAATIKPVANFTSNVTSGNVSLNVAFADKSTGSPTVWKWTFGDGTNSTVQNPMHKYTKAGKYTVSLTVTNSAGSNTATKSSYISVTTVTKPVAAFSASSTSGKAPLSVKFTDKSTGSPTSWKWSFGDGTYSTAQNPTHKYIKSGKYTVKLTVKNAAGSNTKTMSNYITVKNK